MLCVAKDKKCNVWGKDSAWFGRHCPYLRSVNKRGYYIDDEMQYSLEVNVLALVNERVI